MHVERFESLEGAGIWLVGPGASRGNHDLLRQHLTVAEAMFGERPEIASLKFPDGTLAMSGLVTDLLDIDLRSESEWDSARVSRWLERARGKGLQHRVLCAVSKTTVARCPQVVEPRVSRSEEPLRIAVDGTWLLDGASGAQVFVFAMIEALLRAGNVERIILLSDRGGLPARLAGLARIDGMTWRDAESRGRLAHVFHRPYQPDERTDFRRYRAVADVVVMTILDHIAYDIPEYHESPWHCRRYRRRFDRSVLMADVVCGISGAVADRITEQYGAQLARHVEAVPLGTDHLKTSEVQSAKPAQLHSGEPFLLVLGNDFEHKNRDFAVRVFGRLRAAGYSGQLVLAGFHLDCGSSYGHELDGAGPLAADVLRLGRVSDAEKHWLMRHADVVLYPTSAEGFGLVPFEAAAFGTPTAFVSFGPLLETLPGVASCRGWRLDAFADLVRALLLDGTTQVRQIREAAASLTWTAHAQRVSDIYRSVLADLPAVRQRRHALPGWRDALRDYADVSAHRLTRRVRRAIRGR